MVGRSVPTSDARAPGRRPRICVYCGSRPGDKASYREATERLGEAMVAAGFDLVYGGASVGLMGVIADTVMRAGGHVTGVIPRSLVDAEVAHEGIDQLEIVASMHERKQRMADLSAAFVALPGGLGTLEEIFEMATWAQLGLHQKPCGFLNVDGYYDPIETFLQRACQACFIRPEHGALLFFERDPARMLKRLRITPAIPPSAARRTTEEG